MSQSQQDPLKRITRSSTRSSTTNTPAEASIPNASPIIPSTTAATPAPANAPSPTPSTATDTWPRGTPMPIDWPPFAASTWFTSTELTLVVKIARGQDVIGWKCENCDRRCGSSELLLRHIVRSEPCGGTLTLVKLTPAQVLAILAAVDYAHVSDNVCCYVYEWENNLLETSYSDPEPIPTLYSDVKDHSRPDPLFRLNPFAATTEEDITNPRSSAITKIGRPSKRLEVSLPESSGHGSANFYNADKNEHLHLDIDPNTDALEDVVYGNIFPMLPPSFLSEKHRREYGKRIGRLEKYSAHRINYVKPGNNQVSGSEQLLTDWMAQRAEGEEGKHGSYESWLSARCHDIRWLKQRLVDDLEKGMVD